MSSNFRVNHLYPILLGSAHQPHSSNHYRVIAQNERRPGLILKETVALKGITVIVVICLLVCFSITWSMWDERKRQDCVVLLVTFRSRAKQRHPKAFCHRNGFVLFTTSKEMRLRELENAMVFKVASQHTVQHLTSVWLHFCPSILPRI